MFMEDVQIRMFIFLRESPCGLSVYHIHIYFEYVRIKETQLGRHMHHSVSSLLFHSVCFHRQLYKNK